MTSVCAGINSKVTVDSNAGTAKTRPRLCQGNWPERLGASTDAFIFARISLMLSHQFASNVSVASYVKAHRPVLFCTLSSSCFGAIQVWVMLA